MPAKKRDSFERREQKRKKMALLVLEVARATNEGRIPTSRKDLRETLKRVHRIDLAPATLTGYMTALERDDLGRKWLKTDGWDVCLAHEKRTLTDSLAVKALFIAHQLKDDNDQLSVKTWIASCSKNVPAVTEAECQYFLDEYLECEYLLALDRSNDALQLNLAHFNRDSFYLKALKDGKLKKIRTVRKRGTT